MGELPPLSVSSGVRDKGEPMRVQLITPPVLEPISLDELKLHLRLDSGSFSSNIDETQLIPPGSHGTNAGFTLLYELLTLDMAPGVPGWAVGDTLTGATSGKKCTIVEVLTPLTYTIKDRTGNFTLGEIISNETATADQGAAFPTFTPAKVEVLGYSAVVVLDAGTFTTGTVDVWIQDSDDGVIWANWGTAFNQVSAAAGNHKSIQEIAYTGIKRYIRTAAKVLVAACPFGTSIIRLNPVAAEDDFLNRKIKSAREHVENITRRQILTATWDYFLFEFPKKNDFIELPFGNLQDVPLIQYVKYTDNNGTITTMAVGTDYLWETNGDQFGRVVLPYGGSWPIVSLHPSNPIIIRFVCGWPTAALVPSVIKEAIERLVAKAYESRGEDTVGQSVHEDDFYERLLASSRLWGNF